MSLSYWLRDYVYVPLGGSRNGLIRHCRNLLITFAISGLWHGASWSFVLWGVLHGVWVIGELLLSRATTIRAPRWVGMLVTLHVVVLLWIMFRAQEISVAWEYYANLLASPVGLVSPNDRLNGMLLLSYAAPLVAFQIWQFFAGTLAPDAPWHRQVRIDADDVATQQDAGIDEAGHHVHKFEPEGGEAQEARETPPDAAADESIRSWKIVAHGAAMGALAFLIPLMGATDGEQFIYFQF